MSEHLDRIAHARTWFSNIISYTGFMVRKLVLRALALVELPIRATEHPLAGEERGCRHLAGLGVVGAGGR
jgi:hypothetical protein